MKQIMKKVLATLCAITMIVSPITIYNNIAKAAISDSPESITEEHQSDNETIGEQVIGPEYTYAAGSLELMNASYLAGEVGANQYKAICGSGSISGIVNIQKYGNATEHGIYVSFRDADIGTMTVNGDTLNAFIDGAGIIIYLSNFKYMYNDVVIYNGAGTEKAVIYIYNAQGIDNSDKILEAPTNPSDEETTTPSDKDPQSEYTYAAGYNWRIVGFLKSADAGRGQFRAVCGSGVVSEIVNIQQAGSATEPGIYVTFADSDFGEITINGVPLECSIDGSGITMYLSNFEYYYSDVTVKNSDGSVKAILYVNYMYGIDNSDKIIEEFPEPPTSDLTTTQAPTTTEPVTTTKTEPQTTTVKDEPTTTTSNVETTVAPTEETTVDPALMNRPGKVTVKKASKKLTAKKASIKLRKVEGATGYEIAIYKSKKNAKKNEKAIYTTKSVKVKTVVKSKKIKNKKKLFVRVRAYVDVKGTIVTGKWSKVKRIKVK